MIRFATALAVVLLFTAACSAQDRDRDHIQLYGGFSYVHVGTVENDGPPGYTGTTAVSSPNFIVGSTFNHQFSGASLGLDLRLSFLPDPFSSINSSTPVTARAEVFLVGMKVAIHPPAAKIRPYVQFSVGLAGATTPDVSGLAIQGAANKSTSYGVFEALGGIDYSLNHRLSLRVVEFGAGHGGTYSLEGSAAPSTNFYTITTGVVLRF